MTLSLSVVIPSHNRADLLTSCLTAVCQQAPPATDILVVDDGSPGELVRRVASAFPGVRVLGWPARRGFCAAANAGLREARGEVVELLNDDTEVSPGWAEAALARFREPTVGAVAPLVLRRSGGVPTIDSAGDRYCLAGIARKRGHGEPLGPRYLHPCRVFGASASSAFYRREAVLRVGGLPESFDAYFEDVDLSFRLQRAGYRIEYEPASRVLHHVGASHGRPSARLLEQQSCNEERVFWRNVPARVLLLALPFHLAALGAKGWRHWRAGTLAPFLRGRLRLLREVPALLAHRGRLEPAAGVEGWGVETLFWR